MCRWKDSFEVREVDLPKKEIMCKGKPVFFFIPHALDYVFKVGTASPN